MQDLPTEIFVHLVQEGDDTWLNAFEDASDLADLGEEKICGRYELKETVRIGAVATVDAICDLSRK